MTSIFKWSRCVMNSEDCQWFDKQKYSEHTIHFHWIRMVLGKRLKVWLLVWDFMSIILLFVCVCVCVCVCVWRVNITVYALYMFFPLTNVLSLRLTLSHKLFQNCVISIQNSLDVHSDKSSWSIKKSPLVLALGDDVRIHDTVWPRLRCADRGIQIREYAA